MNSITDFVLGFGSGILNVIKNNGMLSLNILISLFGVITPIIINTYNKK